MIAKKGKKQKMHMKDGKNVSEKGAWRREGCESFIRKGIRKRREIGQNG